MTLFLRLNCKWQVTSLLGLIVLLLLFAASSYAQGGRLRIQTSTLPDGIAGVSYSFQMNGAGGVPPYTWQASGLPAGLSISPGPISGGLISGTTNSVGSFSVDVTIRDVARKTDTRRLTLRANALLVISTASPLPAGVVGASYSQTLAASGGRPSYTWSVAAGSSLPAGLMLSAAGVLSGTPGTGGSFPFTVRVTDSSSPAQVVSKELAIVIYTPLSITTGSLPVGTIGVTYSQTLTGAGGVAPYAWSVASGSLPPGLSLSNDGVITGVPSASGTFLFTVRVRDSDSQTATRSLQMRIVSSALRITSTSPLPSGVVGTAYSQSLTATGGSPPYAWSLLSGSLPPGLPGLSLSPAGVISGTPSAAGTFNFTVRVIDGTAQTASQTFELLIDSRVIQPIPSLTLTGLPNEMNPAQQLGFGLVLSAPYPAPLSGTLTISFISNAALPVDDPMVLFSTGSRTVIFTIPANSTVAVFPSPVLLLTGTVAGTIAFNARFQNSSSEMLVGSVGVRPTAPQMSSVAAVRTSGGLRVAVTGYSTDRRMLSVQFGFSVRTENGIQSVNLVRNVESLFENWYQSAASAAFGSSFLFTQSFTVEGDPTAVESVTVTLTNAQGSTPSRVTPFSSN